MYLYMEQTPSELNTPSRFWRPTRQPWNMGAYIKLESHVRIELTLAFANGVAIHALTTRVNVTNLACHGGLEPYPTSDFGDQCSNLVS